ncbi:hypothetical protein [Paenibacillus sp. YYML68]|uniref:hypothetical protein n=1 Tax=Paenibacillus sp. YYML68 TaxID=2909250 RepID=UPI0024937762|nr:hypothetical protein [Paenibacillus sp. YYML68]
MEALIIVGFLVILVRIEMNTKKKLDNDERIIARLDLLINDIRKYNEEREEGSK